MTDFSAGLNGFFSGEHRRCDALWAEVEAAVDNGDAATAQTAWQAFAHSMQRHFTMEEEILFPSFEAATGMQGGGPTFVMRAEHQQMRALLQQMADAAEAGDFDTVVDDGDTLLMLIQQHNAKEEGILYPMAEQHLAGDWQQLSQRLAKIE